VRYLSSREKGSGAANLFIVLSRTDRAARDAFGGERSPSRVEGTEFQRFAKSHVVLLTRTTPPGLRCRWHRATTRTHTGLRASLRTTRDDSHARGRARSLLFSPPRSSSGPLVTPSLSHSFSLFLRALTSSRTGEPASVGLGRPCPFR
jgi:hypothetical protein